MGSWFNRGREEHTIRFSVISRPAHFLPIRTHHNTIRSYTKKKRGGWYLKEKLKNSAVLPGIL